MAWRADLGGAVRGQPLVADGRVLAATETDRVVALDPRTGRVLWSTSVGTPQTDVSAAVGCGNIDPLGVTSTPVVDPATRTVFVVGAVVEGGRVHHRLEGLDIGTGAVRVSADVDPPLPQGETPLHLLQRASLALGNGRVYVSYGGHLGDCGHYHGWVVGADTAHPSQQVSFEVAPDGEGGAIWQSGGAPALDVAGNVYVSTGNANPDPPQGGPDPKRYAESVVKLGPDLRPLADYKDTTAGGDEDLSTGNPVLLPDGRVFAVGKTQTGFLLRAGDLRLLARVPGICGSDPDGGPAYDRAHDRMFVPCRGGGLQVVDLRRAAAGPRLAGADSAPIVVGGTVWAVDSQQDTLAAFDAGSGRSLQTVAIGTDVPVFTSPSAGAGLLLVGTTQGVTAFR
jgi:outer membrane protein assembly factor BamB